MGKPKAPTPPDPRETSAAATGTNVATSVANAFMGNVNQNTPDGSLRYDTTGNFSWKDPYTGKTYNIPRFTATQTLSPAQTALKGQTDAAQINLAKLAKDQSGRLNSVLSRPFDPNNIGAPELKTSFNTDFSADRQKVEDALMARMQPGLDKSRTALDTKLSNQGIKLGSTAYDRGIDENQRTSNDARLGAILSAGQEQSRLAGLDQANAAFSNNARSQAMQEAFAGRNQPINEITALLSGSQVSQPNFINANMPTIPTTDNAGLIQQDFANKMGLYQQKAAASQNILGGLFGLGAAGIMASERRLKKDIEKVGRLDGKNVYEFRYKSEPRTAPKHTGFMVDEVEKTNPRAIINIGGVKHIDMPKALGGVFGVREAA